MKRPGALALSTLSLVVLIVGCAPGVAPTQTEGAGLWEVILQVDVQHPTIAAEFLNETFGITVGDSSQLTYTTDGARTWLQATDDAAQSRAGLDIVDERVAWLVGFGGRVWVSTDGARTWQTVSRLPYSGHIEFISFLDTHTGWAASAESSRLWATADGGQTWVETPLPAGAGGIAAIALRTASDGYLLDKAGVLHVTADGGQSWSSQTLGLDESLAIPVLTPSAAVRFLDADHGLIVLSLTGDGQSRVLSLRTTDGGQTWERDRVPVSIGQFLLTHDGTILTVADLMDSGKITLLRTTAPASARRAKPPP
jgi:photosystem II stability/assembly factor-like uncharacterized protein